MLLMSRLFDDVHTTIEDVEGRGKNDMIMVTKTNVVHHTEAEALVDMDTP